MGRMSATAKEREEKLQERFDNLMPCSKCKLLQICRYANSIKRLDYEPEIFNISITCNMQQNKEDNNDERKEQSESGQLCGSFD